MKTYRVHVIESGGAPVYVSPVQCEAIITEDTVRARADNPGALDREGASQLAVKNYPDRWHIIQVSGYSDSRGMYCDLV